MTLEMTSLPLARVASMFVYIRARFRVPLRSVDGGGGGGGHRGIGGGIQIPEK